MSETKGERTAQRILDAAETLFARKGYEAASLREIAALAEIRQPGLYNHFASKEDLYRAVLDRGLRPLIELMGSLLDTGITQADMIALPGRMTDLLAYHPNISALLMQSMRTADDAGVLIAQEWLDRLLHYGRQVNEASDFTEDSAALMLRQIALFNLCCGYFWAEPLIGKMTGSGPLAPDNLARQKQLLERIMRALLSDT